MPYGYLGVDTFFVVSGYLLLRELNRQFNEETFSFWKYISKRLIRLWPLVILISLLSLFCGFYLMLPNDFENLSESVVASNVFANNILQYITAWNYWGIGNQYKPLMHLWYVGVLMQAYIIIPLVFIAFRKRFKRNAIFYALISISAVSLILYLIPSISAYLKFYFVPFRLFEITTGGLLFYLSLRRSFRDNSIVAGIGIVLILILFCNRVEIISASFMLLATVVFSCVFIYTMPKTIPYASIFKNLTTNLPSETNLPIP